VLTTAHRELQRIIEELTYTCGSKLQDIEDAPTDLLEQVFVKANLSCNTPIEIPYYSSKQFDNICYFCGREGNLSDQDEYYPSVNNVSNRITLFQNM